MLLLITRAAALVVGLDSYRSPDVSCSNSSGVIGDILIYLLFPQKVKKNNINLLVGDK